MNDVERGIFFNRIKMKEIAEKMNFASAEVARKVKYRCTKKWMESIKSDERYNELKY